MRGVRVVYARMHALAEPAIRGDPAALSDLLAEAYNLAYRIIRQKGLSLPSGGDRDDLAQCGVVKLYRNMHAYVPRDATSFGRFAALLIEQGMRTECRRQKAQKRRLNVLAARMAPGDLNRIPDRRPWPDSVGNGAEESAAREIIAAVMRISGQAERVIMRERILGGRHPSEVAAMLGQSPRSVYLAISRLRYRIYRAAMVILDDERSSEETRESVRWRLKRHQAIIGHRKSK